MLGTRVVSRVLFVNTLSTKMRVHTHMHTAHNKNAFELSHVLRLDSFRVELTSSLRKRELSVRE